jgi:hypothetical protein
MFEFNIGNCGGEVFRFEDDSHDEFTLSFHDISESVKLHILSETDCLVFTKEQAVEIANLILEKTK